MVYDGLVLSLEPVVVAADSLNVHATFHDAAGMRSIPHGFWRSTGLDKHEGRLGDRRGGADSFCLGSVGDWRTRGLGRGGGRGMGRSTARHNSGCLEDLLSRPEICL